MSERSEFGNRTLSSSNETSFDSFYFYEKEQLAVLWCLLVAILVGNILVIVNLSGRRANRSRMNYFIRHLAVADLGVGLACVLTDLIWHITIVWHAGNVICKMVKYVQVLVTYASTYILVALSIDRYYAITRPMKFSGSYKRARILITTSWVISILFSLPTCFLYKEKLIGEKLQCWIEFDEEWNWQLYLTLITISLFLIPLLIIVLCYVMIVKEIWSKRAIPTPKVAGKGKIGPSGALLTKRASSTGLIPKAKVKTLKIAFAVVGVFIICWSPYFIFDLLQVYGQIPLTQGTVALATFIQSLAPLNSAANPLVYFLLSTNCYQTIWTCSCFSTRKRCKFPRSQNHSQLTSLSMTSSYIAIEKSTLEKIPE